MRLKIAEWDCPDRAVIYSNYSWNGVGWRILLLSDDAASIFQ